MLAVALHGEVGLLLAPNAKNKGVCCTSALVTHTRSVQPVMRVSGAHWDAPRWTCTNAAAKRLTAGREMCGLPLSQGSNTAGFPPANPVKPFKDTPVYPRAAILHTIISRIQVVVKRNRILGELTLPIPPCEGFGLQARTRPPSSGENRFDSISRGGLILGLLNFRAGDTVA